jgi:heme exporter protein CcmD
MTNWFAMGGYGVYVWGSCGMVVACLLIELIHLRLRFKKISDETQT